MPYPIPDENPTYSDNDPLDVEIYVIELTENAFDKAHLGTVTPRELAEAIEANQLFIEYLDELRDSLCLMNLDE